MMKLWLFAVTTSLAVSASAQHRHDVGPNPSHRHQGSQYAGMLARPVKALSQQQIDDLSAGKGMSLALAAELNGYPGPSHTLELAEQLALTPEQIAATKKYFEQMQAEAKSLGEQVIASERALDALFKDKKANYSAVREATENAASLQGQLRFTHLNYHLKMPKLLTQEQMNKYAQLRGYH